jgi:hypothetical protein
VSKNRLNEPAADHTAARHWHSTWNPRGGNFRSTPSTCINTDQAEYRQPFALVAAAKIMRRASYKMAKLSPQSRLSQGAAYRLVITRPSHQSDQRSREVIAAAQSFRCAQARQLGLAFAATRRRARGHRPNRGAPKQAPPRLAALSCPAWRPGCRSGGRCIPARRVIRSAWRAVTCPPLLPSDSHPAGKSSRMRIYSAKMQHSFHWPVPWGTSLNFSLPEKLASAPSRPPTPDQNRLARGRAPAADARGMRRVIRAGKRIPCSAAHRCGAYDRSIVNGVEDRDP